MTMADLRERVRRELEGLEPIPVVVDDVVRRAARRQRHRRLGATGLGIALTAALVVGLLTALGRGHQPAPRPSLPVAGSGGSPTSASPVATATPSPPAGAAKPVVVTVYGLGERSNDM